MEKTKKVRDDNFFVIFNFQPLKMPKGKKGKGKVKKVVNEKGASSYSSTGNARVDLFFKTVRGNLSLYGLEIII